MRCEHPVNQYQFVDHYNKTYITCNLCGAVSMSKKNPTFVSAVEASKEVEEEIEEDDMTDEEDKDIPNDVLCQGGCGERLTLEAIRAGRDICFRCYSEGCED